MAKLSMPQGLNPSPCPSASSLPQSDDLIQPLAPDVLHRWLYPGLDPNDRPQNLVVWDVRDWSEYEAGHIPQAHWVPLPSLRDRQPLLSPSQTLVLYCRSGKRSRQAAQLLVDSLVDSLVDRSGWPLYDLMGGIQGWAQLGFPVAEVRPCA